MNATYNFDNGININLQIIKERWDFFGRRRRLTSRVEIKGIKNQSNNQIHLNQWLNQ
jgi:hypothetical protein